MSFQVPSSATTVPGRMKLSSITLFLGVDFKSLGGHRYSDKESKLVIMSQRSGGSHAID